MFELIKPIDVRTISISHRKNILIWSRSGERFSGREGSTHRGMIGNWNGSIGKADQEDY
jgi:hypothetical protein